jgi:hypothetical protein
MREEWKPIPGYEGLYEVSSAGKIRSLPRTVTDKDGKRSRYFSGRTLTPTPRGKYGYLVVSLSRENKARSVHVHRIVMLAFVGPLPKGKETRHKDGNKLNNARDNLKYSTHKKNCEDRIKHGVQIMGSTHPEAKLTEDQVRKIKKKLSNGVSTRALAKTFQVAQCTIMDIKKGVTWKQVTIR